MMELRSITGLELKAYRRRAGISQTQMGQLIGCSRHGVSYWETQAHTIKARHGVPARMCKALGIEVLPTNHRTTRARGDGVLDYLDQVQGRLDADTGRIEARAAQYAARYRQPCGAKTRKGNPCRNKSEVGRRRCKFHGGMSTGPKTSEGKARIAAAQRKRWAQHTIDRAARNTGKDTPCQTF